MTGITARSASLSAVNWEPNLLNTFSVVSVVATSLVDAKHTQTWGEEQNIQICDEFLILFVEKTLTCHYVTWQTDAYYFQDCLEN